MNRLDKLDARLDSRFACQFFFDLPSARERQAVAQIHFQDIGCANPERAAQDVATCTEGFSNRELAKKVCPSAARQGNRNPDADCIRRVCQSITPTSKSQGAQLEQMRRAADSLRLANDAPESSTRTGRRIA
jgi:AAA+ superfamily predicted ATPase